MSSNKHTIAEAIEAFDDDALFKVMIDQLVRTFPSFSDAPPRIKAARDRLIQTVKAAPELLRLHRRIKHELALVDRQSVAEGDRALLADLEELVAKAEVPS